MNDALGRSLYVVRGGVADGVACDRKTKRLLRAKMLRALRDAHPDFDATSSGASAVTLPMLDAVLSVCGAGLTNEQAHQIFNTFHVTTSVGANRDMTPAASEALVVRATGAGEAICEVVSSREELVATLTHQGNTIHKLRKRLAKTASEKKWLSKSLAMVKVRLYEAEADLEDVKRRTSFREGLETSVCSAATTWH